MHFITPCHVAGPRRADHRDTPSRILLVRIKLLFYTNGLVLEHLVRHFADHEIVILDVKDSIRSFGSTASAAV